LMARVICCKTLLSETPEFQFRSVNWILFISDLYVANEQVGFL
jgi:hypothetical protein